MRFKATYFEETKTPELLRIILDAYRNGADEPDVAAAILLEAFKVLRIKPGHLQFLLTPGGFMRFVWPHGFKVRDVRNSTKDELAILFKRADIAFDQFRGALGDTFMRNAARFISLGIDSQDPITGQHVELVYLYEPMTGITHRTGKSYPTTTQQNNLVRIPDLNTHIVQISGNNILLLGCHDLNLLSNRALANTEDGSWRHGLLSQARKMFSGVSPQIDVVLHHPHTCDTPKSWITAWSGARQLLPSVRLYAGAGRWWNDGYPQRASLEKCLAKTSLGEVSSVVVTPISDSPSVRMTKIRTKRP